ncbi:Rha family transcriptional regulator [Weissella sp. MSCH1]|uniref:Rha family transcriptional regulator n=1 Tax=Weissella sp. MSCH1 TaxID=3383343 RepID=UPI003896DD00
MTEQTQLVETINGQVTTTSREVAGVFGKEHRHVLRDIDDLVKQMGGAQNWADPTFEEETYIHEQNHQEYRQIRMNKDGFTLLAMGFTGSKATQFKLRYIQAFNEMEETLRSQPALPTNPLDQIVLLAQGTTQLSKEVGKLKNKVDELDGNQVLNSARYEYISKAVSAKVREYANVNNLNYKKVNGELRRDLNRQINEVAGVKIRRDLRDKDFDTVTQLISIWTPAAATIYQLKQMELEV